MINNSEFGEITVGDLFGIIDYLHNGLSDYLVITPGRPYDDDELLEINRWVMRCSQWLNHQIKEMTLDTKPTGI